MRYQIKQRVFSLADSYDITDDAGNAAFHVQGKFFSLGNSLDLQDMQGEPLAHIQQRLLALTATYDISRGGSVELTVHQKAFSWTPHFDIEGPGGSYTMDGDWADWDFQVSAGGQTVARISKQFALYADTYGIEIADGADVPTLLCLAIVMDEVAHPDSQH
jgi:uncharacterized protein YxjI